MRSSGFARTGSDFAGDHDIDSSCSATLGDEYSPRATITPSSQSRERETALVFPEADGVAFPRASDLSFQDTGEGFSTLNHSSVLSGQVFSYIGEGGLSESHSGEGTSTVDMNPHVSGAPPMDAAAWMSLPSFSQLLTTQEGNLNGQIFFPNGNDAPPPPRRREPKVRCRARPRSSHFVGVTWNAYSQQWKSYFGRRHLGYHATEELAAEAHDRAVVEDWIQRGHPRSRVLRLNFPDSNAELSSIERGGGVPMPTVVPATRRRRARRDPLQQGEGPAPGVAAVSAGHRGNPNRDSMWGTDEATDPCSVFNGATSVGPAANPDEAAATVSSEPPAKRRRTGETGLPATSLQEVDQRLRVVERALDLMSQAPGAPEALRRILASSPAGE